MAAANLHEGDRPADLLSLGMDQILEALGEGVVRVFVIFFHALENLP
jgi:hypothetical protein